MSMSTIPTIHLDDTTDKTSLVKTLREACCEYGFFYLDAGHGISPDLIKRVFFESKKLFDLPLCLKQQLSDPLLSRGYTAMEEETLDPSNQRKGDTKEGYYIGSKHVPRTSSDYDPQKLRGPNVWPRPDLFVQHNNTTTTTTYFDCDEFQQTMTTYLSKIKQVGFRLTQLLALAIGMSDEHYFDEYFLDPICSLRLLHYSSEQSRPEEGIYACGAHSDYGMITLLLTDDNPGLQILTKQNQWMDVPPKPNTFVVNLGDMLERWTNGLFRSTVHRVITSKKTERYSIPVFYEPNFDTVVECLDVCCSQDNPPKYPPITSGEYLVDKYKQTHADFAQK